MVQNTYTTDDKTTMDIEDEILEDLQNVEREIGRKDKALQEKDILIEVKNFSIHSHCEFRFIGTK